MSTNSGIIERTGINAHINLFANSGLRSLYEIDYDGNLSNNLGAILHAHPQASQGTQVRSPGRY